MAVRFRHTLLEPSHIQLIVFDGVPRNNAATKKTR
jgi:hypothetical protein